MPITHALPDLGSPDVITNPLRDYAVPRSLRVIATLLGIPTGEYATFRSWSLAAIGYTSGAPEERAKRVQEMVAYLGGAIAARRTAPSPDLISALIEAEIDGASLDVPEIIGFCDRFEAIAPGGAPAVRQSLGIMPYGFDVLPLAPRRG